MSKHLHIISFDIPYPANYGGVIDVFYKLQAFQRAGIKVHLHCFEYGREHSLELDKYCEEVQYYKRNTGIATNISTTPYIINENDESYIKAIEIIKDDYKYKSYIK